MVNKPVLINTNKTKAYVIIGFLLSPIASLVYGLKKLDTKGKLLTLTLFGLLYGILINYSEGNDAASYVRNIESYYVLGLEDFFLRFLHILSFSPLPNSPSDLYLHVLFGIAGSMFTSPIMLFALVGAVYGYFYGRALLKVIDLQNKKLKSLSVTVLILIGLFVIHRSFDSMQTIRSWTGMWVLFNGVFSYHQTQKKKYLALMLFAPFFHLMYLFIALPALLFALVKIPKKLILIIYITSFIANINTVFVVQQAADSDLAKNKLSSYYRIDKTTGQGIDPILNRQEDTKAVWYAKYGKTTSVYYGATAFFLFLIIGGYYNKQYMNKLEYALMSTGLLMASLANFLSFAFALYSRTMANASIYILAVMVLLALRGVFNSGKNKVLTRIGIWVGILIFIPKIVFFSSDFLYRTSFWLFSIPFVGFFDTSLNFSIRDFIDFFI